MDILNVLGRTLFFYFFILLSFRIMGKREVGQLSITDLTISILIAELVAISIENREDNLMLTVGPIILLVILEIILAYIELRISKFRDITNGKPSVIIMRGKLNIKEMIRQRYSLDDLLLTLRDKEIKNIKDVNYAILETNGKLSIFKKKGDDGSYPLPLIVGGVVDKDSLYNIDKTEVWLNNLLRTNGWSVNDILYAFYKKRVLYVIRK